VPLYEHTLKRHSYDIPFSDTRHIVPPNTPAAEFGTEARTSDSEIDFDVGVLTDKIGKVKTTRRGLVRELPETVRTSVLPKRKVKGRGVNKKGIGKERMV
jgi:hypothetical protein